MGCFCLPFNCIEIHTHKQNEKALGRKCFYYKKLSAAMIYWTTKWAEATSRVKK